MLEGYDILDISRCCNVNESRASAPWKSATWSKTVKDMENHERVERELLEQCGQVATLVECFAWL